MARSVYIILCSFLSSLVYTVIEQIICNVMSCVKWDVKQYSATRSPSLYLSLYFTEVVRHIFSSTACTAIKTCLSRECKAKYRTNNNRVWTIPYSENTLEHKPCKSVHFEHDIMPTSLPNQKILLRRDKEQIFEKLDDKKVQIIPETFLTPFRPFISMKMLLDFWRKLFNINKNITGTMLKLSMRLIS